MSREWHAVRMKLCVVIGVLAAGCSDGEAAGGTGGAPSGGAAGSSTGAAGSAGSAGSDGAGDKGGSGGGASDGDAGRGGSSAAAGTGMVEHEGCVADPVPLADAPGATVLAGEGLTERYGAVALGAEHVFVSSNRGIERVSKQGGTSELVVADTDAPRFRLGGDNLYYIREGALHSVPATATEGTPTVVAPDIGVDEPNDNLLAVDDGYAYLWARATEAITRLELATEEITPVVEGVSNIAWHIYDGFMYFGDDFDRVMRVPLAGGEPAVVYSPPEVLWSLAAGPSGVFVGSYGAIYAQAEASSETLFEDPFTAAGSQMYIERVAIHGDQLLFTGSAIGDDRIGWVKIDGSSCATYRSSAFIDEWAFDDTSLYVSGGALLYKLPL
jgi:hypothetical protein